ncbi:MAG: amidohydrolase family protein [Oscillospiraceae bacterium]|jgi:imidazolonepropionase-like amidohydrolase|nr:amidohydrolase family protein [Oscillospiraceae bacterium]
MERQPTARLIPRLTEAHGHIIADGADYRAAQLRHRDGVDREFVRSQFETLRSAGVAFYRDGGDALGVSVYAKTVAAQYGIDYRTPAFILHRAGRYGAAYGRSYRDLAEARGRVAEAASLGADFVKIAAGGLLDFAGDGAVTGEPLPEDEIAALVEIAAAQGFAVMAHVSGAASVSAAVRAGVRSVEHGFWADQTSLELMRDRGTVWVPTAATVRNNLDGRRYPAGTMRRIADAHEKNILFASKIGVLIASGSDAGAYNVPQGAGAAGEAAYLRGLGVDIDAGNAAVAETFRRLTLRLPR